MNRIFFTRTKPVFVDDRQARQITEQWLDQRIGDHYLLDGHLMRNDDYGNHRGGVVEVEIVRVTEAPKRNASVMADREEMHASEYDFLVDCIKFRFALRSWVEGTNRK